MLSVGRCGVARLQMKVGHIDGMHCFIDRTSVLVKIKSVSLYSCRTVYLNTPEEWFFGTIPKLTDGCPWVVSQRPWRMVLWSHPGAHRRLSMSGISTPLTNVSLKPSGSSQGDGRDLEGGIFWANGCLVFSLKIIKLLQMRWVKITSERLLYFISRCRIIANSAYHPHLFRLSVCLRLSACTRGGW